MPGRGEPGEVSAHDPQCQVMALTLDVGAGEPVESDGIARRALDDIRELDEGEVAKADAAEQLDALEARIAGHGVSRVGRQTERRFRGIVNGRS